MAAPTPEAAPMNDNDQIAWHAPADNDVYSDTFISKMDPRFKSKRCGGDCGGATGCETDFPSTIRNRGATDAHRLKKWAACDSRPKQTLQWSN